MIIVFAIALATVLIFWILRVFVAIDYFYAPVVISVLGLIYLFSIRGFYRDQARLLITRAKRMEDMLPLAPEEETFLLSSASIVLPRFYRGAQMPANGLSLLTLMNFLFLPLALYFGHYTAAASSAATLFVLLRFFGFFSRNETYNVKQSCLQYLSATGRSSFTDMDMQDALTLYGHAIEFTDAVTKRPQS